MLAGLFVTLALSATAGLAQLAQVYTRCTQPNTAALTFVCFVFQLHASLLIKPRRSGRWSMGLSVSDNPVIDVLPMLNLHSSRRYDVSKALVAANATGTFFFSSSSHFYETTYVL